VELYVANFSYNPSIHKSSTKPSDGPTHNYWIIGIIVGAIVVLALGVVVVKAIKKKKHDTNEGLMENQEYMYQPQGETTTGG